MSDYRDLVITDLADENAALHERIASLEADVRVYAEIARAGIHNSHGLQRDLDRLRCQHQQLVNEYRALKYGFTTGSQPVSSKASSHRTNQSEAGTGAAA